MNIFESVHLSVTMSKYRTKQTSCTLTIDLNLQRHRAVSLRQYGFLLVTCGQRLRAFYTRKIQKCPPPLHYNIENAFCATIQTLTDPDFCFLISSVNCIVSLSPDASAIMVSVFTVCELLPSTYLCFIILCRADCIV